MSKLIIISYILFVAGFSAKAQLVRLYTDLSEPKLEFATNEVKKELESLNYSPDISGFEAFSKAAAEINILIISADNPKYPSLNLNPTQIPEQAESYVIRKESSSSKTVFTIIGSDLSGAMYGGIDFAERIKLYGIEAIRDETISPYIEKRGLKFNIPLDARTPGYADFGSAAQANIANMWDITFWKEFIDQLARHHYNTISLWNEHPFPSLIKLSDYPDVALDDVKRTTLDLDHLHSTYDTRGKNVVSPEILSNLETIKTISINEKIIFWQDVMQYAHDRGIAFYFFTWNVFIWGADGKHEITNNQDNKITKDYYKKCITQMFVTYPHLAGIGLTAGENMKGNKEEWLFDVYAEGMMDAQKQFPERDFTLIHRTHQTGIADINDLFKPYTGKFDFSFKYAGAHIYAYDNPTYTDVSFNNLPEDKRAWLELRNDDIFNFRWGDPDFVRRFITNLPSQTKLRGFLMGPDGYVWGRDFTSTSPEFRNKLEINKHWYRFKLWGNLSYNPNLNEAYFKRVVDNKFPQANGELFEAWTQASKIFPIVTEFHWWRRDLEWAVEGGIRREGWPKSSKEEFHSLLDFIQGGKEPNIQPGSPNSNIVDYVNNVLDNKQSISVTPPQVIEKLRKHSALALSLVKGINSSDDTEQEITIGDIKCMALLGNYYAEKIEGAVNYQFLLKTADTSYQTKAIANMKKAAVVYKEMADIAAGQYKPQILARNGHLDWQKIYKKVLKDIDLVSKKVSSVSE